VGGSGLDGAGAETAGGAASTSARAPAGDAAGDDEALETVAARLIERAEPARSAFGPLSSVADSSSDRSMTSALETGSPEAKKNRTPSATL
jgi:hypothetical protein